MINGPRVRFHGGSFRILHRHRPRLPWFMSFIGLCFLFALLRNNLFVCLSYRPKQFMFLIFRSYINALYANKLIYDVIVTRPSYPDVYHSECAAAGCVSLRVCRRRMCITPSVPPPDVYHSEYAAAGCVSLRVCRRRMCITPSVPPPDVYHSECAAAGCVSLRVCRRQMCITPSVPPPDVYHSEYAAAGCVSLRVCRRRMCITPSVPPPDVYHSEYAAAGCLCM